MIDARNTYTVMSARSHVFSEEQLANLTAITWLHRGQNQRFVELLGHYQQELAGYLQQLKARFDEDDQQVALLDKALGALAKASEDATILSLIRTKLGEEHGLGDEVLADFRTALEQTRQQSQEWSTVLEQARQAANRYLADAGNEKDLSTRKANQTEADSLNAALKAASTALEARHKAWLKLLDNAEKLLRARQWTFSAYTFAMDTCRDAKKALLHRDVKKREKATVRDLSVEACKRALYFIAQGHRLLSQFPDGVYVDVPGLCKRVDRATLAANDWSLTPGRYVGVAVGTNEDDDGEAFRERMKEIHSELAELNDKAVELAARIQAAFAELVE